MFDSNTLIAAVIWGAIGSGFALYGWRQKSPVVLCGGIALIAICYFISSALFMSLLGVVLTAGTIWLNKRL